MLLCRRRTHSFLLTLAFQPWLKGDSEGVASISGLFKQYPTWMALLACGLYSLGGGLQVPSKLPGGALFAPLYRKFILPLLQAFLQQPDLEAHVQIRPMLPIFANLIRVTDAFPRQLESLLDEIRPYLFPYF